MQPPPNRASHPPAIPFTVGLFMDGDPAQAGGEAPLGRVGCSWAFAQGQAIGEAGFSLMQTMTLARGGE
jgi:hypothetical protein